MLPEIVAERLAPDKLPPVERGVTYPHMPPQMTVTAGCSSSSSCARVTPMRKT
jgi:hypothetical protein